MFRKLKSSAFCVEIVAPWSPEIKKPISASRQLALSVRRALYRIILYV